MNEKLEIPEFGDEELEAHWWFEKQEALSELFRRAAAAGKLGRGTVARQAVTPATTIRLDPEDRFRIEALAQQRALSFQSCLKMLIHEALQRESAPAA